MQREYLTEDLRLIQKYFPGAKPVAMCTPFDLTNRPLRPRPTEALQDDVPEDSRWYGDIVWNR
jgi:hypothetical protein